MHNNRSFPEESVFFINFFVLSIRGCCLYSFHVTELIVFLGGFYMILGCKDIQKSFGVNIVLENITFHIEQKEKAAIVGVNGAGKTTLFKILTGQSSADGGELYLKKDISLGYLAQNQQIDSQRTIFEEMMTVFEKIQKEEKNLREMENKMAELTGKELSQHMEKYALAQHSFEQSDGYGYQSRIRGVLKGLGFLEGDYHQPISQLSGGQKTRVYLSKLLLSKPDILLLDEPTNHLDIASIQWLEDFLKGYAGAVLLISHDRYFLDRIVTKVIEIENKKSSVYEGNYTFYAKQKNINRQIQQKAYDVQQKEIKRQEDVIKTLKAFNREKSIKRAQSREKALQRMQRIEKPENLPTKMRLMLTPKIISGNDVLKAEGLAKTFDCLKLFENVNFDIKRGEKVAIIGPNGVGKSTLFKILLGQVKQDAGQIYIGTNVQIGYYDQEQQELDETKTIFQEIADAYPTMENGEIRNVLAAFVFTGDDIYKSISTLSGGEKGRVSLAKLMLSNANLLMLDEPTNHLDMYSKEILEEALNCYEGTVIYISHDRYFINTTAQKVLELTPTGVNQYLGDYQYYLQKKEEQEIEKKENAPKQQHTAAPTDGKTDWLKQKQLQSQERKAAAKIERIEKEIEQTEQKIAELDNMLFQQEVSSDFDRAQKLFEEKTDLEQNLEKLYEQWETLQ